MQPASAGAEPVKYVALGDSFSAGEGVDPYFRDGFDVKKKRQTGSKDNRCHRSTRAYAEHVQLPLRPAPIYELASEGERGKGKRVNKFKSDANVRSRGEVTWALLACSGARVPNVLTGGTARHQDALPQLDWPVLDATTTLITITIGGNDAGFSEIVKYCLKHACDNAKYRTQIDQKITGAIDAVGKLYPEIRAKAPSARVLVLGYPMLFPASRDEQRCSKLRAWRGEQDMLRGKQAAFNSQLSQKAAATGFEYLDVAGAFAGHEICGKSGEWINGPSFTGNKLTTVVDDEAFHPTVQGQKQMAGVVNKALVYAPPAPAGPLVPAGLVTSIERQTPLTASSEIAPGYSVTRSFEDAQCVGASNVAGAGAYRCFTENFVLDPCYALAEPFSGDAVQAVCPVSPFSSELTLLEGATGLSVLDRSLWFDEPIGLELEGGEKCTAVSGSRSLEPTTGRAYDYGCDDRKTAVLRGLHKDSLLWTAEVALWEPATPSGKVATIGLRRAVLPFLQTPPANRPVTDTQGATSEELHSEYREHHEVDCGTHEKTRSWEYDRRIYVTGVDCSTASLLVTEWETGNELEPGWNCLDDYTLFCQPRAIDDDPAAFFSSAHLRAVVW